MPRCCSALALRGSNCGGGILLLVLLLRDGVASHGAAAVNASEASDHTASEAKKSSASEENADTREKASSIITPIKTQGEHESLARPVHMKFGVIPRPRPRPWSSQPEQQLPEDGTRSTKGATNLSIATTTNVSVQREETDSDSSKRARNSDRTAGSEGQVGRSKDVDKTFADGALSSEKLAEQRHGRSNAIADGGEQGENAHAIKETTNAGELEEESATMLSPAKNVTVVQANGENDSLKQPVHTSFRVTHGESPRPRPKPKPQHHRTQNAGQSRNFSAALSWANVSSSGSVTQSGGSGKTARSPEGVNKTSSLRTPPQHEHVLSTEREKENTKGDEQLTQMKEKDSGRNSYEHITGKNTSSDGPEEKKETPSRADTSSSKDVKVIKTLGEHESLMRPVNMKLQATHAEHSRPRPRHRPMQSQKVARGGDGLAESVNASDGHGVSPEATSEESATGHKEDVQLDTNADEEEGEGVGMKAELSVAKTVAGTGTNNGLESLSRPSRTQPAKPLPRPTPMPRQQPSLSARPHGKGSDGKKDESLTRPVHMKRSTTQPPSLPPRPRLEDTHGRSAGSDVINKASADEPTTDKEEKKSLGVKQEITEGSKSGSSTPRSDDEEQKAVTVNAEVDEGSRSRSSLPSNISAINTGGEHESLTRPVHMERSTTQLTLLRPGPRHERKHDNVGARESENLLDDLQGRSEEKDMTENANANEQGNDKEKWKTNSTKQDVADNSRSKSSEPGNIAAIKTRGEHESLTRPVNMKRSTTLVPHQRPQPRPQFGVKHQRTGAPESESIATRSDETENIEIADSDERGNDKKKQTTKPVKQESDEGSASDSLAPKNVSKTASGHESFTRPVQMKSSTTQLPLPRSLPGWKHARSGAHESEHLPKESHGRSDLTDVVNTANADERETEKKGQKAVSVRQEAAEVVRSKSLAPSNVSAIKTRGEHESLTRPVHMKRSTTQLPHPRPRPRPGLKPGQKNHYNHTQLPLARNRSKTEREDGAHGAGNVSIGSSSVVSTVSSTQLASTTSKPRRVPPSPDQSVGRTGDHSNTTSEMASGKHHSEYGKPTNLRKRTESTTTESNQMLSDKVESSTEEPTEREEQEGDKDANLALPEDFARVRRSIDWPRSPYVSQAHLDRLWNYLFSTYYKEVPPVPEYGGPLPVGVGINVVKFKDFDEVAGTMNVAINLRLCWADARLSFSAKEFFNMTWSHEGDKIPVRSDLIWTPDITILNEVSGLHRLLASHTSPLVLADDGFMNETGVNVLWSHPLDVKSNCEVDMSQYPFDEQQCYIVVGAWASSHREMVLVPQPFFEEDAVHTSEFQVHDITFHERTVYSKSTAQMFNEVVYSIVLRRYPHYYVINYILPMVAMTLLTVATMWMSPGNVGPRVNSGTKLLLCVVSIIFITARNRPAVSGDIWMDRFQSHCLALSMAAVLESLFIDWLQKISVNFPLLPRSDSIDMVLRACIASTTTFVVFTDAKQVEHYSKGQRDAVSVLWLFSSFKEDSSRLLVGFVYVIFVGLLISSFFSIVWVLLPHWLRREIVGAKEERPSAEESDHGIEVTRRPNGASQFPSPLQRGSLLTAPHYRLCPTEDPSA